jgi:hypothetical protein
MTTSIPKNINDLFKIINICHMKVLFSGLLFSIIIVGCAFKPDNKMNDAVVHICGVFITDNIQSIQSLRIRGSTVVKNDPDSTYRVTGTAEGFSPMNFPESVQHFSETVHYLGGDPNDKKNWTCIEIYVGNKKMK